MERAIVIWFSDIKGYGFVRPLKGGTDRFVHHTAINKPGYRSLQKAEFVDFEPAEHDGRPVAVNVTPVDTSDVGGSGSGQRE